ncbi:homolog of ABC-type phosphate transport system substrate-binding protein SphX/PstS [Crocosphaera watsonii WH 0402]|uniref:Homolog of ABC-type phosphate transport system substrate-binding protein SphX/PstS n=1 Tax=Crocosphaera watsonii WH 0402 TaxID=1284629 RepID=T2JVA9_CROWT|nr:homolog of ABC-type phosphate transport system substrate-binding protein SphX/PstS [Crocosphaera watsonii WH 0402]
MNQNKETLITVLSLIITLGILGGGYWFFTQQPKDNASNPLSSPTSNNQPLSSNTPLPSPPSPSEVTAFTPPTRFPKEPPLRLMVQLAWYWSTKP